MNKISSSNSGENSGTSKNIKESDEEKTDGGNLLSRCHVASFSDVVSSFSSDQQVAVNETDLGSLFDLKCGRLRQELCAALIQQCDVGRQSIILHGKEYNLSPTVFATIMGVRDGGTRVDLNDQAVDITDLRVVYSSGPRGIHIAKVKKRLMNTSTSDDEFKILFSLFALGTILCPTSAIYINQLYLRALKDTNSIRETNWASWCFTFLWEGVQKFKENKVSSVSGCVLFLKLFYFSSVVYDRLSIDRTICPISVWNNDEIRRFLKWQKKLDGIKSSKVSIRDPDRLHKPEQAEPPGWNNANNDAFQLLMERFGSFVAQNKESFQTIERRLENIEKILGELTSKYHGGSSKQLVAPNPLSNLKSQNRTSPDGKTMSKTEGKIILNLAEPLDTKQEFQTSTSMSVPATRPARNRRSGRYQRSPYDKVSREAKAKFKAGHFYVNNPLSLDQLKLIQYAFDKGGNGSEIIISTDDQFISRHNFMSLLPNTTLSGEILTMIAYHLTLCEWAKRNDAPINWYLPTIYAIYVPINDGTFHWFLFIVNVKEGYGEVWNPLPDGRSRGLF
ncbi:PMD domain-containing protein [Citrus sinensis]|nr:PMD domain-containing protein [Citrus sinensis]